jgi:hypothetical protein
MVVNPEQIRTTLKALLLYGEKERIFTSEELQQVYKHLQKFGSELEKEPGKVGILLSINNIALIGAIIKIWVSAIKSDEGAARLIFDEEISYACERITKTEREGDTAWHKTEPTAATPFAVVRQEAVGHGCFHTGVLGVDRPIFRWVYDCGSWTKKSSLQSRVDELEQRCRASESWDIDIDLLFISHFDADHVSGLGILLGQPGRPRLRVHTAVIPYIAPTTGFEIIFTAAARGRCTGDLVDAVIQPARYCAERNIQRLVIVRPRRSDGGAGEAASRGPPPRLLGTSAPPGGGSGRVLSSVLLGPDGSVLPIRVQNGIEVTEAMPGTVCAISAHGRTWADWWFIPHAHEWSRREQQIEELAKLMVGLYPGEAGFSEKLVDMFRVPCHLGRIRHMYRPLNANGTSLSLYVGPPRDLNRRTSFGDPERHRVGWLLTGDTPLQSERRITPWKESFETIREHVGYLMLPHHGAAKNFNSELLRFAENARCFATVNSDDYREKKRPPRRVRCEVGARLLIISEESSTVLKDLSGAPNLEHWADEILQW